MEGLKTVVTNILLTFITVIYCVFVGSFSFRFFLFVSAYSQFLLGYFWVALWLSLRRMSSYTLILDLFLGWDERPIFVVHRHFTYARVVGWARESTFPDAFYGYSSFFRTLDFSQKTSTLNLSHTIQVVEKK